MRRRHVRARRGGAGQPRASHKDAAFVSKTDRFELPTSQYHDPTAALKQRLLSANKLNGMEPAPIDWKRRPSPEDREPFVLPDPGEKVDLSAVPKKPEGSRDEKMKAAP